jgi:xylan 1,4-beta-xylosidase
MSSIRNPILPGFNPDPSMCRVGEDYYIATSTFEWYPGVQIFHSRDLLNWRLVKRPLERKSQLDMRGNPDSCGIWAPCLSHADGKFWLVYTDVKRYDGNFKDAHNYIVTCPTIDGDWSEPIYANSSGFDPSLFHDDDGRKWFVNMKWNHKSNAPWAHKKNAAFDGIVLQEFDADAGKLVGDITTIFKGSDLGLTEAPHLFKRGEYYYLTTAEGGTGYEHAVTLARSKSITGPYELHPQKHVLTAAGHANSKIQRVGHGQLVETPKGEWVHSFLMGRPMHLHSDIDRQNCPMGRETGLAKCEWRDDDWLYLSNDSMLPDEEFFVDDAELTNDRDQVVTYNFENELPIDFQWLRTPEPERIFNVSDGRLRLIGRESVGSWFEQSLVARRQEHFKFHATTIMRFSPDDYQQNAGLIAYYNRHKFHFLAMSMDPELGRVLTILSCDGDWPECRLSFPLEKDLAITEDQIELGLSIEFDALQFYWRPIGGAWSTIGPTLDAAMLSDEGGRGEHASFTGNFVGMAAFDTSGRAKTADFTQFKYDPSLGSIKRGVA